MATEPRIRYDIEARATGRAEVEALAAELKQLDDAIDPAAAQRAEALGRELKELGQQRAAVEQFAALKKASAEAAAELQRAQTEAQEFAQALSKQDGVTRAQAGQLEKLRDAVRAAKGEYQASVGALDASRAALSRLGLSSDQLGTQTRELGQRLREVTAEVKGLSTSQAALQGLERLAQATNAAETEAKQAQTALAALRTEIGAGGTATAAQAAKLGELSAQAQRTATAAQQAAKAQADAAVSARSAGAGYEAIAAAQARATTQASATVAAGQRVAQGYREQGAAAQASAAQQAAAAATVRGTLEGIGAQLRGLQTLAGVAIGGTIFTQLIGDVAETADAYTNLAARIKLVTGEGAAFDAAFQGVYEVAARTNSALEGTGTLFARIAQAGKEIGLSQRDALALTETINQAIQLSGGSAASADAAITQLIQGLQNGVLRGDEFNSVMEQAPRLSQALASGLGVTTGELRKMADAGKLTSEVVIRALQGQAATLRDEFATLPATVGRALQNLSTEWTRYVGQANEGSGATAQASAAIDALAANIGPVVDGLFALGKAYAALKAYSIAASLIEAATAARAGAAATATATAGTVANTTATAANTAAQAGNTAARAANAAATGAQTAAVGAGAVAQTAAAAAAGRAATATAASAAATAGAGAAWRAFGLGLGPVGVTLVALAPEIVNIGRLLGESVAKWTGAGDAAEQFAAKQRAAASDALAAAQQQAEATRQFADVQIKTAEQVARLDAEQLARYEQQLEGRRKYESALYAVAAAEVQLGQATQQAQDDAQAAVRKTMEAIDELQAGTVESGAAMQQSLSPAAKQLVADFEELRGKGKSTAEAISSIGRDFDPSSQEGLRTMGQVLGELEAQGKLTADQVRQIFEDALDEDDILAFETRARAAFAGIRGEAQVTQGAIDAALRGAIKATGRDMEELQTGISSGAQRALNNFDLLMGRTDQLKAKGFDVGETLRSSLDQSIAAANTEKALIAVQERARQLGEAGHLVGEKFTEASTQIQTKLDEIKPGVNSVGEAWRKLGVDVSQSAQRQSEELIAAYEKAKASGTGSARDLQDAFVAMAQKVLEENGGIVNGWLEAEAQARGLTLAVDEFGRVSVEAFGAAAQAAASLGDKVDSVAERLAKAGDRFKDFKQSSLTYDDDGFATGKDGQRISYEQQVDVPEGSNFDRQAFMRDSRLAAQTGGTPPNPNSPRYLIDNSPLPAPSWMDLVRGNSASNSAGTSNSAPNRASNRTGVRTIDEDGWMRDEAGRVLGNNMDIITRLMAPNSRAPAPAPARESPSSANTRQVTVNLNLGDRNVQVPTTEQAANALLRELESARRSMGYTQPYTGI